MINIQRILPMLMLIGLFSSCDDDDEPIALLDKEVRLSFPFEDFFTNDNIYQMTPAWTHLLGFDKSDYAEIDSVFMVCAIRTQITGDTAWVRLYNITDNIVVLSSELTQATTLNDYIRSQTENIIDNLPDKRVDLALQIKSSSGDWVFVNTPYLKLRRK